MTRNHKILGLALVAVLAMSAVAASMASAQGKFTSDGPVTLVAKPTGATLENSLTAFGGTASCANPVYTGHKANATPHTLVPSGSTELTVTPHYGLCTGLGFPTTIDMNGCDFTFDLKGTTGVADTYNQTATFHCSGGATPVVTIFSNAANHTAGKPFCEIELTPQTDPAVQNITVRDTTNGTLDITGTIEGIEAHERSPTGSILCPSNTTSNSILHLDLTVEGKNSVGGATAISLSD